MILYLPPCVCAVKICALNDASLRLCLSAHGDPMLWLE